MFQRFHENTQIGRLVKHILATELVPNLQTVNESSYLIEGCRYIYQDRIIECTSSGVLSNNFICQPPSSITFSSYKSSESWYDSETHKYLGNYLRYLRDNKSIDLMPYYNCYNATELTDVYIDPFDLRIIVCSDDKVEDKDGNLVYKVTPKDKGQFCGQRLRYTSANTYTFGSPVDYKVVAVPVKFDTTYTIAVDSHSPVALRGIIYNKNDGMIKEYKKYPELSDVTYYSDYLNHTFRNEPTTSFNKPFTYRVDLASSDVNLSEEKKRDLYSRHNDLYMIIQLPATVNSSIVVLEGDYTQRHVESTQGSVITESEARYWKSMSENESDVSLIIPESEYVRLDNLYSSISSGAIPEEHQDPNLYTTYPKNLSLLYYNTGVSYAFSNRLVEYLLLDVIDEFETLPSNIARAQTSLSKLYNSYSQRLLYKEASRGVWDDAIPKYVNSLLRSSTGKVMMPFDHDGRVNKDVEELLSQKGVYLT